MIRTIAATHLYKANRNPRRAYVPFSALCPEQKQRWMDRTPTARRVIYDLLTEHFGREG